MTEKTKWKKLGGGSFRLRSGRIIKPNQTFDASPDEIPAAFRDIVVPVTPLPPAPKLDVQAGAYQLRHRGSNWYDILDGQGKVVNEKALRQDEARKIIEGLAPGEPIKEAPGAPEK